MAASFSPANGIFRIGGMSALMAACIAIRPTDIS
jgi:hypothetical protein